MIAVIDTNVLVSGMINADGSPGRIVDLIRTGDVIPAVDDRILEEYADVLSREYFERYFSMDDISAILDFLSGESHRVVCNAIVSSLPDPGDTPFLETALSANVPLITGNKKHFKSTAGRQCEVLTPVEFLQKYFISK